MRHLLHATSLSTSAYHTLALTTTAGTQNCHHSFRKLSRTLTTNITLSTMAPIERITLFNIPKEEDRLRLVEEYKQLVRDALKDGKPYISNASFGPSIPDPRSKGYNFGVKTTFASLEDMKFYDTECQAHKTLKGFVGPRKEGDVMTVYYENAA